MELKGLPEGSRPTRCHSRSPTLPSASVSVKTFEMLWIENGVSRRRRRDVAVGVDHDKAEGFGIDPGQFGNIGRDLAAIRPLRHLVGDLFHDMVKIGHGSFELCIRRAYFPASQSIAVCCFVKGTTSFFSQR